MELPDNIKKLLESNSKEDIALGAELATHYLSYKEIEELLFYLYVNSLPNAKDIWSSRTQALWSTWGNWISK